MQAAQTLLSFNEAERQLGERLLKLAAETDRIEGYREPHAIVIARLAERLGARLGLHGLDLTALKFAALAHDLGARAMKRDYLLRPSGLNWEEQLDLWRHPIIGEQAAADLKLPRPAQLLIRWHHEWWNGLGYPDSLSGVAIPLGARILRVVDSYCALRAERPHRQRMDDALAEQLLADQSGIECDPQVVKHLLALLAEERQLVAPHLEPPEAVASAGPQEETPFVSAWDTARGASSSLLTWRGLTSEEASERSPATQDVPPELGEPEVEVAPLAPATGESTTPTTNDDDEVVTVEALPPADEAPTAELREHADFQILRLNETPDHFWPVANWIYEQWLAAPGNSLNTVSDLLKEHLANDRIPFTLVAEIGGEPVGSVSLVEDEPDAPRELSPWLTALYVQPLWRRRGIGASLLNAAILHAKALGMPAVYLALAEGEDFDLRLFYLREGWQVLERGVGAGQLTILMKQTL